MERTGYPPSLVRFVKGKVEDTLMVKENLPAQIAVLRLDTDWFESTKVELDVLFPRLSAGGFLLIDDYCTWGGQRKATDTWLEKNRHMLHEESIRAEGDALCFMAQKKDFERDHKDQGSRIRWSHYLADIS